ncbi:hypothetical protein COL8621_01409 [Actibacterium lipolyticum]|uniref:Uncharacterized protein n=1 Tax=Actibacterium lipolyticum TaxID=1524263 RepID=A0A238JY52_9RHOB|nr:hypothetical protein COL8621_01409 [Actibacterium lipolyticum]
MALFMTFISYPQRARKGMISQPVDRRKVLAPMIEKMGGRETCAMDRTWRQHRNRRDMGAR